MYDPNSGYHGADAGVLQAEGVNLAQQAVTFDTQERYDMALFYYTVSISCCFHIVSGNSKIFDNFIPKFFLLLTFLTDGCL